MATFLTRIAILASLLAWWYCFQALAVNFFWMCILAVKEAAEILADLATFSRKILLLISTLDIARYFLAVRIATILILSNLAWLALSAARTNLAVCLMYIALCFLNSPALMLAE